MVRGLSSQVMKDSVLRRADAASENRIRQAAPLSVRQLLSVNEEIIGVNHL